MLDTLLATLVGGLALGFLYGLVALTLILLVRTTGVLNFAAADIGMLCAFVVFAAATDAHLPLPGALGAGLVFSALLGVAIYCATILVRAADHVILSLRTLGLLIIVRAVVDKLWGKNSPYNFPKLVPEGSVEVLGLYLSYTQLAVIVLTLAVAGGVGVLTERTRIGLMLRAVSADRDTASDLGVAVVRVDMVAWVVATLVAAVVAVLVAQLTYLAPNMMQPILLAGFAAAQLGDMQSIRVALIAGLVLGVIQSTSSVYLNQPEWSQVIAFLVLTVGLVLRGQLRKRAVVT